MPELVAGGRVLRYHTPRRWLHPPLSTPHARARRQRPCPPSSHRSSSPAAASVFTPELIAGGRVLCVLRYQRCLAAACVCSCSGNEKEDDTVVSGCRSLTFPKKKTISIRRSPPISNSLSSLLLHHRRRRRRSSPATATAAMNYIVGAFKPPCDISVAFSNARTRKQIAVKNDNGRTVMVPLFQSLETISGEVSVAPVPGKRIEHLGVKIELLGQIELYLERGKFYDFTSLVRELDIPGEIYEKKTYPFEFSTVEMPYESYNGTNVRLRYILKVTISRNIMGMGSIVEFREFCVRNYSPAPTINNSIKA